MKTIERKMELQTKAPENKTIKLSVSVAKSLYQDSVADIIEKGNTVPIDKFWENEEKTLVLWELLWVDKSRLGNLTLSETLSELDFRNYQESNNTSYKWKTVPLAWKKAS